MDPETALQILPRVISPIGLAAGFIAGAMTTAAFRWLGVEIKAAAALSFAWAAAVMANLSPPRQYGWPVRVAVLDPQFPILDVQIPTLSQLLTINDFTVNIVLFAPAGFLTAVIITGITARRVGIGLLVLVPLLLETIQASMPVLARVGTTSDWFYEASGGVIAFLLGSLWKRPRRAEGKTTDVSTPRVSLS